MRYRSLVVALSLIGIGSAASAWEADLSGEASMLIWSGLDVQIRVKADNIGGDVSNDSDTLQQSDVNVILACWPAGSDEIWGYLAISVWGVDSALRVFALPGAVQA